MKRLLLFVRCHIANNLQGALLVVKHYTLPALRPLLNRNPPQNLKRKKHINIKKKTHEGQKSSVKDRQSGNRTESDPTIAAFR